MDSLVSFLKLAVSLLLSVVVIIGMSKAIAAFTPIVNKQQESLTVSMDSIQQSDFEQYDYKTVYGTDIYSAINTFSDTDFGIIVRLNYVDNYTGESRLHYITPMEVSNEISDDMYLEYLDDDTVTLTDKRLGGESATYDGRKFFARLVKDANNTVRGIYFEEEDR